jgi:CheY-like chemotaxis protein
MPPVPAPDTILIVLIVEDDQLIRDIVADNFRDAGWVVLEAESGDEALDHLENAAVIDVIFTDIRLKGAMNGWDVGEACRRKHADMPVVYTTGDSIEPQRPVSGSKMFRKPYDPVEVQNMCFGLIAV